MSKDQLIHRQKKESSFASGLIWGTILGAAGMFIFATKKGKEARKFLKKHGQTVLEELEEVYEEIEADNLTAKKLLKAPKKPIAKSKKNKIDKKPAKKPVQTGSTKEKPKSQAKKFFTRSGRSLKK